MSIESAREVLENEMAARDCGPMLDALIDEAQAAMPCARSCCDDDQLESCPSCQARAKLAAQGAA